jgi:YggT family protein
VGTTAETIKGILRGLQTGAVIAVLGYILFGLISIYILLVVIRIVFSWGRVSYTNRIMRFLVKVTEPLLAPMRRMIPPIGPFDISPIAAIILILLLKAAVQGTLLR